jgi:hypothetical protein
MHLSDDDIRTVVSWLNTGTWAESSQYYAEHSSRLLDATTPTVLDELTLIAPAGLILQHRRLLEAIRVCGPEAIYQELLASETPGT